MYRIKVSIRDETGAHQTNSYIEFLHLPHFQICNKHQYGLAELLYKNAMCFTGKDDCCKGQNIVSMSAVGTHVYGKKLCCYKLTNDSLGELENKACCVFDNYGLVHWVGNLSTRYRAIRANINTARNAGSGSNRPWMSLCVTTANYGNESHQDLKDACQGITIWHERDPGGPANGNQLGSVQSQVRNWYFIFPDMEIMVKGKWKKGVAIPLQHGTVVSWDACLVCHATAIPTIEKHRTGKNKGQSVSAAFGT